MSGDIVIGTLGKEGFVVQQIWDPPPGYSCLSCTKYVSLGKVRKYCNKNAS